MVTRRGAEGDEASGDDAGELTDSTWAMAWLAPDSADAPAPAPVSDDPPAREMTGRTAGACSSCSGTTEDCDEVTCSGEAGKKGKDEEESAGLGLEDEEEDEEDEGDPRSDDADIGEKASSVLLLLLPPCGSGLVSAEAEGVAEAEREAEEGAEGEGEADAWLI